MDLKPLFICALALVLTGCGDSQPPSSAVVDSASQVTTVDDVLTQQQAPITAVAPALDVASSTVDAAPGFGSYDSVDIDLTTMNATMVYAQVYGMLVEPEDYLGKTVKVHGLFAYYYEESVDTYYYGIIVEDATACCAQGIEFVLAAEDAYAFPEDYPETGESVTLVGVYTSFFPEETPNLEYHRLEQAEFITE